MNEADYLKTRVEDQIDWYNRKGIRNKNWFRCLRMFEIITAALIPFLIGFGKNTDSFVGVIGLLGPAIIIITATISLFRLQENWVEYRAVCESLKHEKYLYLTRTGPYNTDEAFEVLVQRVESTISAENRSWSQYTRPQYTEKR